MKSILLAIGFLLLTAVSATAQSPLPKGAKQFNAGVGLSGRGIPVYLGLDFGVHPDISVGAEVNFRKYTHGPKPFDHSHNIVGILGNANYHFNRLIGIPSNWDLYAGVNLGFYIYGDDDEFDEDLDDGLDFGAQIGGRYYFTPRVGVNLEFGGGTTLHGGKLGISVKF